MKYTLVIILIAALVFSCKKEDNEIDGVMYQYIPRKCNFVFAKHAYLKEHGPFPGIERTYTLEHMQDYAFKDGEMQEAAIDLKAENYIMAVNTSNINSGTIYWYFNPYFLDNPLSEEYFDARDISMENQLKRYFQNGSGGSGGSSYSSANLKSIEYRLNEVKNLRIFSTNSLFGEDSATALNAYFQIYSVSHAFIFDANKQLIAPKIEGWSIGKYLSIRPFASELLYLRFKSLPPELPVDTRMVVEMELANGDVLRDTSSMVRLLP
ncbi:hypothetical protein [Marinifilum caeruleilacunae]|uniref:Uncharacterized protein n=1 Tax=Marinifilum caeruleilacunae TaxID=2499076 RepID=A0ABX1WY64_9BACT|nr:hypothetical protein [Marinifilum caeruleilacunae]NOU60936.1 hypothetical protein [Marinifilum caeruleilacunae]